MHTCPQCGVELVSRNLSHSCGDYSVERFLAGKGPAARALFERFMAMVTRCGPCSLAPAKTRVAFVAQVRWASVNGLRDGAIDVHFVLPRRLRGARFRKVEEVGRLYVHHLRLAAAADFDGELQGWLQASRDEYGERAWLAKRGTRTRK